MTSWYQLVVFLFESTKTYHDDESLVFESTFFRHSRTQRKTRSRTIYNSHLINTQAMENSIVPILKTLTFFLMIISILVAVAREITMTVIVRSTGLDDYLIALSLVSSTGTLRCKVWCRRIAFAWEQPSYSLLDNQLPCSSRLKMDMGRHPKPWACHCYCLDSSFVSHHLSGRFAQSHPLQSEYTAALLYIPSLFFAKPAVLALVWTITPNRWDRQATYTVAALLILWVTTAEFAAGLTCLIQNKWEWPNGQCSGCVYFDLYFSLFRHWSELSMFSGTISRLQIYFQISRL